MKTIMKCIYATFAVAILAIGGSTANAAPGDLFVSDLGASAIYKFTPDGTQSTFATGVGTPLGLAFDSAGNLFEADGGGGGSIYKFTPDGTRSTFVTGLSPWGLAFDSAGNLFEGDSGSFTINKITPDGTLRPSLPVLTLTA